MRLAMNFLSIRFPFACDIENSDIRSDSTLSELMELNLPIVGPDMILGLFFFLVALTF